MSYIRFLKCHQRNCGEIFTVPIKLIIKGNKLIDVTRCPNCHRSYKIVLPMTDKNQWFPIIEQLLFKCYKCGETHIEDYDLHRPLSKRLKFVFRCRKCRKKIAKVISRTLWNDLVELSLEPLPKVEAPTSYELPEKEIPAPEPT
ncbi:MAG: hypothetical protein ACFFD2_28735, partial [Promethearchaeota archaeon]